MEATLACQINEGGNGRVVISSTGLICGQKVNTLAYQTEKKKNLPLSSSPVPHFYLVKDEL